MVLSGGTETISSGGVASGVTGSGTSVAGGELDVQSGGTAAFASVSLNGVLNLSSGGTAHDVTVSSDGNFNVAGTTTSNVTISSGGAETVSSGGVVSSGTRIVNGGSEDILDGGTVIGYRIHTFPSLRVVPYLMRRKASRPIRITLGPGFP